MIVSVLMIQTEYLQIPQYNIYAAYFRQSQERLMQQLPTKENTNDVSFNLFPNPEKNKLFINFEVENLQDSVIIITLPWAIEWLYIT
jgi:hypothetical protein